jgi:trans-aconitate methyltransferase
MIHSQAKDVWATGLRYQPYVGRWSRLVAEELLTWLSIPDRKDWLDVGCGTGALTQTILEYRHPNAVRGH